MARHQHDQQPIVILMEDDPIHTDEYPFCSTDPDCPCHEDQERIATVADAVLRGELTPHEAKRDWRSVQLWLEYLTNDTQARTEPLAQVCALSQQAVAQQQRLWHLVGQVRREQGAYPPQQAATGGGASHGA